MIDLKTAMTPAAVVARFAEAGIVISERTLRDRARKLGAYRVIGNTMFLMPEDIEAILEAAKPEPRPTMHVSPKHPPTSPKLIKGYAELVALREAAKSRRQ